jgi:hypothetical protein
MATRTFNAALYFSTIKPVEGTSTTTTVKVDGYAAKLVGEPTTYDDHGLEKLARAQTEAIKLATPKVVTESGKQARTTKPVDGDSLGDFYRHHTHGTMPEKTKTNRSSKVEPNPATNGEAVTN